MARSLELAELVDLEAALCDGRPPEALLPEALWSDGLPVSLSPPARTSSQRRPPAVPLLRAWLDAVYAAAGPGARPGRQLARAFAAVTAAAAAAGVILGIGTAQYCLRYDGTHPVNVVTCLSLLILPQLSLLIVLVAIAGAGTLRGGRMRGAANRPLGWLHRAVLAWVRRRAARHPERAGAGVGPGAAAAPASAGVGGVGDLRALYRPAEIWRVFIVTQVFGVAFNLGAIVVGLGLVTFTDLAFAWSTTLRIEAATAHRVVAALGRPFAELVPSLELVEATRYFRLDGRYAGGVVGRAVDVVATGAWWPFLAACLIVYGLLPRVLLLAVGYIGYRRRLRRAPLDAYEVDRLLRALAARAEVVGLGHARLDADGRSEASPSPVSPLPVSPSTVPSPAGVALVWRDAPWSDDAVGACVRAMVGWTPTAVVRAGGDLAGRPTAARLPRNGPIYVLVDSFEMLQKALLRFLRGLRAGVGERRLIVLLPVEEVGEAGARLAPPQTSQQRRYWRMAVRALGDAYLGAEVGSLSVDQAPPASTPPENTVDEEISP